MLAILLAIQSAIAFVSVSESDIIGKWSDGSCSKSYVYFKSNGVYQHHKWNEDFFTWELKSEMYWWIDQGTIGIGEMRYDRSSVLAIIVADQINTTNLIGSGVHDGRSYSVFMTRC